MNELKKYAEKTPLKYLLAVALLAAAVLCIPTDKICALLSIEYGKDANFISNVITRVIGSAVMVLLIMRFGFNDIFKKFNVKGLLFAILPLLVCINNLPFSAIIRQTAVITENGTTVALFLLWSLAVAVFEELCFRGVIFPLALIKLKNKRAGTFWAVVLSSAVFGCMHLLNLLAGSNVGAVFLQVGYSFLIGSMCAIVMLYVKNITVPIILHFVYNVCGLLMDNVGELNFFEHWDTITVIITVILAVITIVFMVYAIVKKEKNISDRKVEDKEI